MFDIGWPELFVIAVLALVVIGPKDLPQALRAVMAVVRKARGLAREFQQGVDEMVREAEISDIKRQFDQVKRLDLEGEVKKAVDPAGTLTEDFDPADFARELKGRVENETASKALPAPEKAEGEKNAAAGETAAPAVKTDG